MEVANKLVDKVWGEEVGKKVDKEVD